MEPIIQVCFYKSNVNDDFAVYSELNSLPSEFPNSFCTESGRLTLHIYKLYIYIGTGLLRKSHELIYEDTDFKYNLRGCVCYRTSYNEYIPIKFPTAQSDTYVPNKFYRIGMATTTNLENEDFLSWFGELYEDKDFIVQFNLTNLLGSYGSFQEDTNGDGLADGWNISSGLGKAIETFEDKKWQHIWETYSNSSKSVYSQINATMNNIYFVRLLQKVETNDIDTRFAGTVRFYDYTNNTDSGFVLPAFPSSEVGFAIQRYGAIKALSSKPSVVVYTSNNTSVVGKRYDVWIAQVAVYDLTLLGRLPEQLADYFGRLYWTDLATTSIIRAMDGRKQSGLSWLNELLMYVDNATTITVTLPYPFKTSSNYYYKKYIFTYDADYKAEVLVSETQKTKNQVVEITYEREGRTFKRDAILTQMELNNVELVALFQRSTDALIVNNLYASCRTNYNTAISQYSIYVANEGTGIWYFDRTLDRAFLYKVNEIMLIHKNRFDKIGEKLDIGTVISSKVYITPFTRSAHAIILLPNENDKSSLRKAGLSETIWAINNSRFVIDSSYWYSLYINLLEEFSGPNDDEYVLENSIYIINEDIAAITAEVFSTFKEGQNWYLQFNRSALPEPAEEFYCLVGLWDLFDNFDATLVFASGYAEELGGKHKDWLKKWKLKKNSFVVTNSGALIPLSKYLVLEENP